MPWMMPQEERESIRQAALTAMENHEVYQLGETRLTRLRTPGAHTYRVEHGTAGSRPPKTTDHGGVQAAIATFLYYRQRRCTSCGQPGCAEDLVGKAPFVVGPLPTP